MKQEKNNLNFNGEIPITPGYRKMKFGGIYNGENKQPFEKGSTSTGTEVIIVYLSNESGACYKDSFFLTPKARPKLLGVYFQLFGKALTESFNSVEEMVEFLNNKYNGKYAENDYFNMKICGEISNQGTLFCQLPFSGAIIKDPNFVERDFTTEEEKIFVRQRV